MKNLCVLSEALSYIEDNLRGELAQERIAAHCCCSLSGLQKLFRYAFNISVGDYVARRRLTCCARELVSTNRSALDIALDYGYNSAEVFTRAFTRLWGEPPAAFRRKRRFSGLFPRLELNETEMGGSNMTQIRRKYDISELYDYFTEHRGTYILAFDIEHMIAINEIDSAAGDVSIREAMRRIEEAAGENMLFFRIGGDEFALATGLSDAAAADRIAQAVLSRNGEPFTWADREIPLSLYATKVKIGDRTIRYSELYPEISEALDRAKQG